MVQPVRMYDDGGLCRVGDFYLARSSQERIMEGMEVHVATDHRIIGRVSVDPEEGSKHHKHMG